MTPPRSTIAAALLGGVLWCVAGLHGQPPSLPEPPAAPLTLDEAMTAALAASPSLAAARLGRAEAQARQDIARLRPNPDLNLERTKDLPHDAATLSVPIERGGKRGRRIALAEAQARTD